MELVVVVVEEEVAAVDRIVHHPENPYSVVAAVQSASVLPAIRRRTSPVPRPKVAVKSVVVHQRHILPIPRREREYECARQHDVELELDDVYVLERVCVFGCQLEPGAELGCEHQHEHQLEFGLVHALERECELECRHQHRLEDAAVSQPPNEQCPILLVMVWHSLQCALPTSP